MCMEERLNVRACVRGGGRRGELTAEDEAMLKQRTTASPADDGILPTKLYTHKARHASPHVHIPFPRVVSVHQRNQSTRNLKFTFISYLALCVCVCVCVCVCLSRRVARSG